MHAGGSAVGRAIQQVLFVASLLLGLGGCAAGPSTAPPSPSADRFEAAIEAANAGEPAQAFALMTEAADLGEPEAIAALGSFVETGLGVAPDPIRARELFELAHARGSAAGTLNLGLMLIRSEDPADPPRGVELLESLYTHPPRGSGRRSIRGVAAGGLGVAHLLGRGVAQDLERGVGLLEEADAVDVMSPDADYLLGNAREYGWGGREIDPKSAYHHYSRAAERQHPGAQWRLGMLLLAGHGTKADPERAYAWVRRAAEVGEPRAEISLAVMLALGQGTARDPEEARAWYGRGVARNLAHPIRGLGLMLLHGEGGPVDAARGWAYVGLAAEAGDSVARQARSKLSNDIAPADRTAAEAIEAEWLRLHGLPRLID